MMRVMSQSEIKKTTLDQFVRLGGYQIVKQDKESGRWKGISKAAQVTQLSDETIRTILKQYPEPPLKTLPIYVQDFYKSEGYRILRERYGHKDYLKLGIIPNGVLAFKILDKKDPISWTEEDFQKLWRHPNLQDHKTEWIDFNRSVNLRRIMQAIGRGDLLERFTTKMRKAGSKRHWYLSDEDIIVIVQHIDEADVLISFEEGIATGARWSGLTTTRPDKINYQESILQIYEPKTKQWVDKYVPRFLLDLIVRYIGHFNIPDTERLYKRSYAVYCKRLERAGKAAGVKRTVSTHIMKHTFVTQACNRDVSLEVVSQQCGTDPKTLQDYYFGVETEKMRHELLGEKYEPEPFPVWLEKLHPYFVKRFEEIKDRCIMTAGGVRRRKKKQRVKGKAREIRWNAIEKMVAKFDTLPHEQQSQVRNRYVIPFWKRALENHRQGKSDREAIVLAKQSA
jgi:hypothetical protein